MGQLDGDKINQEVTALLSSLDATDKALVKNIMLRQKAETTVTDGGTAATAQTETAFWYNHTGSNVRILATRLLAPVAITFNASNYATFTLAKRDAAGGTKTTVAALDTTAVSVTAFLGTAFTPVAGADIVVAGGSLTIGVAKAASGVAIAAATSQAMIEVLYEVVA